MEKNPAVTQRGFIDLQVCVPAAYTDRMVEEFANEAEPPGTKNGWKVKDAGDPTLAGDLPRVPCEHREQFVHVALSV